MFLVQYRRYNRLRLRTFYFLETKTFLIGPRQHILALFVLRCYKYLLICNKINRPASVTSDIWLPSYFVFLCLGFDDSEGLLNKTQKTDKLRHFKL